LFLKDNFDDLKKFPISMMRLKLASDTQDYVLQKVLRPEKVEGIFEPENFFINSFPCIE
jgi:hypothetical protein